MDIDIISTRELAILRCRGRLLFDDGAPALREAARRALRDGRAVALDLACVTQVDAYGTGVLAELSATARAEGRGLTLAGASDRVRRVLRVTRLDTVIPGPKQSTACEATAAYGPALVERAWCSAARV